MFIWELPQNSELTVEIKAEDKMPLEFKSQILLSSQRGKCVFLEPLREDNKILNFDVSDIRITAYYITGEDLPIVFKKCTMQYISHNEHKYHAVICSENGVNQNRRNHFRVPVDEYCHVNNGKATVDGIMVNVSSTGFAFVVSHWDNSPMDQVLVSYHDTLLNMEFKIKGKVVRTEPREGDRTLFGCRILLCANIEKYISARQRKLIQVSK